MNQKSDFLFHFFVKRAILLLQEIQLCRNNHWIAILRIPFQSNKKIQLHSYRYTLILIDKNVLSQQIIYSLYSLKNSACLICKSCFFSETNLDSTVDTNTIRRVLRNNSKIRFHQYCWCFRGSIPISVLHLSIDYLSQHDHQNSISQETKKNALTFRVSDFSFNKKKLRHFYIMVIRVV